MNVAGRETLDCVAPEQYETLRDELVKKIGAIPGRVGAALKNRGLKPQDLYKAVNGVPPDLLVYPDDLNWRAIGTVRNETISADENDTGPDDANHDSCGIFAMNDG